jgi:hypothetical protein
MLLEPSCSKRLYSKRTNVGVETSAYSPRLEIVDRSDPIGDDIEFECAVRFGDRFAREAHVKWAILDKEGRLVCRPFRRHC